MKNYVYLMLVLGIALVACQKDKNKTKQYSTWYINGQEINTNEVNSTIGKVTAVINSFDNSNRFSLTFNVGYFPTFGEYWVNCSQQNPSWCCLSIYYNGKGYYTKDNIFVTANRLNNKASYDLDSSWMFDALVAPTDSILVYGTFNEP